MTNSLTLEIAESVKKAPQYDKDNLGFKKAELDKVIIIRGGTQLGNDTIDLQFKDAEGNKYVAMVTAKVLKAAVDQAVTIN